MPRTLQPAMASSLTAAGVELVHFIELAFSGGTVRVCTGAAPLAWNGQTWAAVGGAVGFERVTESADLSDPGVQLSLSGVDQTALALLLTQQYLGRSAKVWLGHVTTATGLVVVDPVLLFQGAMNGGWTVTEDRPAAPNATATVTITGRCTGRLAELNQRRGIQTNTGAHQAIYPGDLFFQFVGQQATRPLLWKP